MSIKKQKRGETEIGEEEDQQGRLKDFLKSLDDDMEERVREETPLAPLPPLPKVKSTVRKDFKPKLEAHKLDVALEKRFSGDTMVSQHYTDLAAATPYEVVKRSKASRGSVMLSHLKSKKEMVILHEIISKPLSLRR